MERHLRLVKPAGPKEPRKPRRRPPVFSPEEQARLRAALKNARALFGSWSCLSAAMHLAAPVAERAARGSRRVTAEIAVRLARALGIPLESLYAAPRPASKCPMCGQSGAP